jgi:hypothetical protein
LHPLPIDQSIPADGSKTVSLREGNKEMVAISWKNPSNGDWSIATNWSTGAAPMLSDNVTISTSGSYVVTISPNNPPNSLADVANSLTFDAPQASLVESAAAAELIMVGALTVKSGSVSLNTTNILGSVALSAKALSPTAARPPP